MESFRKNFYEIVLSDEWLEKYNQGDSSSAPVYESLLTAFDFHRLSNGELRLIEVNTNASLFLPILSMYSATETPVPKGFRPEGFLEAFQRTYRQALSSELKKVYIFDEQPDLEGLYFEFLLNKEFFEQNNIQCEIIGTKDLEKIDLNGALVYNRHTDFFLEKPELNSLKNHYQNSSAAVSPHPCGYQTMAQKA